MTAEIVIFDLELQIHQDIIGCCDEKVEVMLIAKTSNPTVFKASFYNIYPNNEQQAGS